MADPNQQDRYAKKLAELQKHAPFLETTISQLKTTSKGSREIQLAKMESLHAMITDTSRKFKYEILLKCEEVINKLQSRMNWITSDGGSNVVKPSREGVPNKSRSMKSTDGDAKNGEGEVVPRETRIESEVSVVKKEVIGVESPLIEDEKIEQNKNNYTTDKFVKGTAQAQAKQVDKSSEQHKSCVNNENGAQNESIKIIEKSRICEKDQTEKKQVESLTRNICERGDELASLTRKTCEGGAAQVTKDIFAVQAQIKKDAGNVRVTSGDKSFERNQIKKAQGGPIKTTSEGNDKSDSVISDRSLERNHTKKVHGGPINTTSGGNDKGDSVASDKNLEKIHGGAIRTTSGGNDSITSDKSLQRKQIKKAQGVPIKTTLEGNNKSDSVTRDKSLERNQIKKVLHGGSMKTTPETNDKSISVKIDGRLAGNKSRDVSRNQIKMADHPTRIDLGKSDDAKNVSIKPVSDPRVHKSFTANAIRTEQPSTDESVPKRNPIKLKRSKDKDQKQISDQGQISDRLTLNPVASHNLFKMTASGDKRNTEKIPGREIAQKPKIVVINNALRVPDRNKQGKMQTPETCGQNGHPPKVTSPLDSLAYETHPINKRGPTAPIESCDLRSRIKGRTNRFIFEKCKNICSTGYTPFADTKANERTSPECSIDSINESPAKNAIQSISKRRDRYLKDCSPIGSSSSSAMSLDSLSENDLKRPKSRTRDEKDPRRPVSRPSDEVRSEERKEKVVLAGDDAKRTHNRCARTDTEDTDWNLIPIETDALCKRRAELIAEIEREERRGEKKTITEGSKYDRTKRKDASNQLKSRDFTRIEKSTLTSSPIEIQSDDTEIFEVISDDSVGVVVENDKRGDSLFLDETLKVNQSDAEIASIPPSTQSAPPSISANKSSDAGSEKATPAKVDVSNCPSTSSGVKDEKDKDESSNPEKAVEGKSEDLSMNVLDFILKNYKKFKKIFDEQSSSSASSDEEGKRKRRKKKRKKTRRKKRSSSSSSSSSEGSKSSKKKAKTDEEGEESKMKEHDGAESKKRKKSKRKKKKHKKRSTSSSSTGSDVDEPKRKVEGKKIESTAKGGCGKRCLSPSSMEQGEPSKKKFKDNAGEVQEQSTKRVASPKRRGIYRELELLQRDVKDMWMSNEVIGATGKRSCTVNSVKEVVDVMENSTSARRSSAVNTKVSLPARGKIAEELIESSTTGRRVSPPFKTKTDEVVARKNSNANASKTNEVAETIHNTTTVVDARMRAEIVENTKNLRVALLREDYSHYFAKLNTPQKKKKHRGLKRRFLSPRKRGRLKPKHVGEEKAIRKIEFEDVEIPNEIVTKSVEESFKVVKRILNLSKVVDVVEIADRQPPNENDEFTRQKSIQEKLDEIKSKYLPKRRSKPKGGSVALKRCSGPVAARNFPNILDCPPSVFCDRNYFFEETMRCKLCSFHGKAITAHYKTNHVEYPVLSSRLKPEIAEELIERSRRLDYAGRTLTGGPKEKHKYICPFCPNVKVISDFTHSFYDHLTGHTGEFRHSCDACGFVWYKSVNVHYHCLKHHQRAKVITGAPPPNSDVIFGYMCSECNFVQTVAEKVEQHVAKCHPGTAGIFKVNLNAFEVRQGEIPEELIVAPAEFIDVVNSEAPVVVNSEALVEAPDVALNDGKATDTQHLTDRITPEIVLHIDTISDKDADSEPMLADDDIVATKRRKVCPVKTEDDTSESPAEMIDGTRSPLCCALLSPDSPREEVSLEDVPPPLINCKDLTSEAVAVDEDNPPQLIHYKNLNAPNRAKIILQIGPIKLLQSYGGKMLYACAVYHCTYCSFKSDAFGAHCKEEHGKMPPKPYFCAACRLEICGNPHRIFLHVKNVHAQSPKVESPPQPKFLITDVRSLAKSEPPSTSAAPSNDTKKGYLRPVSLSKLLETDRSDPSGGAPERKSDLAKKYFLHNSRAAHFYKCPVSDCLCSTATTEEFLDHCARAHAHQSGIRVECLYCAGVMRLDEYADHLGARHNDSRYSCSLCFYRGSAVSYVKAHIDLSHSDGVNAKIILTPPVGLPPPKISSSPLPRIETLVKAYKCGDPGCDYQTLFESNFLAHFSLNPENTKVACGYCHIPCINDLRRHFMKHAILPYHCRYCGHGELSPEKIIRHLAVIHSNMPPRLLSRLKRKNYSTSDTDMQYELMDVLDTDVGSIYTNKVVPIKSYKLSSDTSETKRLLMVRKLEGGQGSPVAPSTPSTPYTPSTNSKPLFLLDGTIYPLCSKCGFRFSRQICDHLRAKKAKSGEMTVATVMRNCKFAMEDGVVIEGTKIVAKRAVDLPVYVPEGNFRYTCGKAKCSTSYLYPRGFESHLRQSHLRDTTFDCKRCHVTINFGAETIDVSLVMKHLALHGKRFDCPHCWYVTDLQAELAIHVRKVHSKPTNPSATVLNVDAQKTLNQSVNRNASMPILID